MIPEIGHFALVFAFIVAIAQGVLPLIGAARGYAPWIAFAPVAATIQFTAVAIAFAALMYAYVTSDFSVANVVANSHTLKPIIYKISGVWGNHEGSLLLWVLILSLFGLAVVLFGRDLPPAFRARVLSVQSLIAVGFLAFSLFTSNPFRLDRRKSGCGLGPLGAALDLGSLVFPDRRCRPWQLVGLLRIRLGRLVVLGSG
jgi:cytochrome c-type biogenesis protein CcmF